MKEASPISLQIGRTISLENGTRITVNSPKREFKPLSIANPGSVAKHETAHIIPTIVEGYGIIRATIIPNSTEGYEGATWPVKLTGASVLGPKGMGHTGTSHDERVAMYMHIDFSAAETGRKMNEDHPEEFNAVASVLQDRQSITGYEAKEAFDSVKRMKDEEKELQNKVDVTITTKDGEEVKHKRVGISNGYVIIRERWANSPNAPEKSDEEKLASVRDQLKKLQEQKPAA